VGEVEGRQTAAWTLEVEALAAEKPTPRQIRSPRPCSLRLLHSPRAAPWVLFLPSRRSIQPWPPKLFRPKSLKRVVYRPTRRESCSQAPPPGPLLTTDRLYCTNLNDKIQKQDLRRALYMLFSTYGPVLDVVALKTMKMRGQAHIVFRDVQASTQAMRNLQDMEIFGKKMVR
jgi:hypothetical protein